MKFRTYLIVCYLMLAPASAWTQQSWDPMTDCPAPPSNAAKAQMAAGNAFGEAETNYQSGRPIAALKGFLCSHRIMQHENTLFNIAQIVKLEEQRTEAIDILQAYVDSVPSKIITQPIDEILTEIKGIENAEQEKALATNDQPPATTGDDSTSDANMNSAALGDNTSAVANTNKKHRKIRGIGIAMLSVGISSLAAGTVFQVLAGKSQTQAEETDDYAMFQKHTDKMGTFQAVGIAGFAAGGVLTTLGAILIGKSKKSESMAETHTGVTPIFTGLYNGVSLQRCF